MFAIAFVVALLTQQSPAHTSSCTVGKVGADQSLYYLCLNAHGERVTVERQWFVEHCTQTNARDETNTGISAFCNAYAPRFGPVSEAGKDQSRDKPAKPKEHLSSKLKRWGSYAVGALITGIYIYGKAQ